jgi:hypothetical protein
VPNSDFQRRNESLRCLFNYLAGAVLEEQRHVKAKRFSSFEINHQVELDGRFAGNRQAVLRHGWRELIAPSRRRAVSIYSADRAQCKDYLPRVLVTF